MDKVTPKPISNLKMYQNADIEEEDLIPKKPNNDFLRVIMNAKQLN